MSRYARNGGMEHLSCKTRESALRVLSLLHRRRCAHPRLGTGSHRNHVAIGATPYATFGWQGQYHANQVEDQDDA